jgi:hypothetical protein
MRGTATGGGASVENSYATMRLSHGSATAVGGLVGRNNGRVVDSYAVFEVVSGGGLVDGLVGGRVVDGYIVFDLVPGIGGLVGTSAGFSDDGVDWLAGVVEAGYWDKTVSGALSSAGGSAKTTAELQSPTDASGIYGSWDGSVWDFGTATQYPRLRADLDDDGTATACEFGGQGRCPASATGSAASDVQARAADGGLDAQRGADAGRGGEPVAVVQPDGSVLVSWQEPSDVTDGTLWRIRRRGGGERFKVVARRVSANDGIVQWRDTAGEAGFEYSMRPFGRDGDSRGKWSPPVEAAPNAAPVFAAASMSRSVAENSAAGTPVGAPVAAADPGDTLAYSLAGPGAASFAIDAPTGQISVADGAVLDHEHADADSFEVTVTAVDTGGLSASVQVLIEVTDVAEAPAAPEAPSFREVRRNRFRFTWTAAPAGDSPTDRVDIEYKQATEPDSAYRDVRPAPRNPPTRRTTRGYNLINRAEQPITAATTYQIRIREGNAAGWGPWSQPGAVTTEP